ncbi:MAG: hypothetical protein IJZ73_01325 [Clostridia bacterium]|nr:hypothetical protein [Clostridia bacterium]
MKKTNCCMPDYKLIKSSCKWEKVVAHLPTITLAITLIFAFVWGIVDTFIFKSGSGRYAEYGTFEVKNKFLNWFLWQLIFVAGGTSMYFFLKIILSPLVLHIEYLKVIANIPEECFPADPVKESETAVSVEDGCEVAKEEVIQESPNLIE